MDYTAILKRRDDLSLQIHILNAVLLNKSKYLTYYKFS